MELTLEGVQGVPDGGVLSIKIGEVRRAAALTKIGQQFRFSSSPVEALPTTYEVLVPAAPARSVMLDPLQKEVVLDLPGNAKITLRKEAVENLQRPIPDVAQIAQSRVTASDKKQMAATAANYLDEHGLVRTFQGLLHGLLVSRPEDPWLYVDEHIARAKTAAGKMDTTSAPTSKSEEDAAQIKSMEKRQATTEEELAKTKLELERLKAQASSALKEMMERRVAAEEELAKAKLELESLQVQAFSELEEMNDRRAAAEEELAKAKLELESLQAKASAAVASLKLEMDRRAAAEEELTFELERLQAQASSELKERDQLISAAKADVASLKVEMDRRAATEEEVLTKAKIELERIQAQTSAELKERDQLIVSEQADVASLKLEMDRRAADEEELRFELERLQAQASSELKEQTAARTDKLLHKALLSAAQTDVASLKVEMDWRSATEESPTTAKIELERLQAELKERDELITAAQADVASLKHEMYRRAAADEELLTLALFELERLQSQASDLVTT